MENKIFNVLFLCTGNSARSIFAECLINRLGRGKFRGFSAGSHPKGEINPFTLYELERNNYDVTGLRSKDLAEFSTPGAPKMDFVFTVCDKAAAEVCPVWPGHPMTAHWGVPDPAEVEGNVMIKRAAFASAFRELQNRISAFVSLPFESLEQLRLQANLDEIGSLHVDAKETPAP
jgi:arsenate reductase